MSALLNLGYDVEEWFRTNRVSRKDVNQLRDLLKDTVPLAPRDLTDAQLVPFLYACDNDLDATTKCIHKYYTCRLNGPELFNNRDTARKDIQSQLKCLEYVVLPKDTEEGYRIVVHRLQDFSSGNYHMEVAMKTLFMSFDAAYYKGPPKGLITLFDMRGVGLMHLTRVRLGALRKFFQYLQESLPLKLHKIHVLNCVYFMDKVLALIRPLMNKELYDSLILHPSNMDMEEFHRKHLPKSVLPSDFGGDLPSVNELHEKHCKELEDLVPYFMAEEKQRGVIPDKTDQ